MSINIYEGEKRYVKYNHLLKQSNIDGLTPRPKGKTKVVNYFVSLKKFKLITYILIKLKFF